MAAMNDRLANNILGAWIAILMLVSAPAVMSQELNAPRPGLQPVRLPTEQELQAVLSHLDGFMVQLDRYISDVYRLTEDYREYVQTVKQILASCKVEEDISTFEAAGFSRLAMADKQQCNGWVQDFDEIAWQHAEQLTAAQEYQELVRQLGENVSRQQDRVLFAMRARRLNDIVEQGFRDVDSSRQGFAPWMDK